jgi:hypothetical protein
MLTGKGKTNKNEEAVKQVAVVYNTLDYQSNTTEHGKSLVHGILLSENR